MSELVIYKFSLQYHFHRMDKYDRQRSRHQLKEKLGISHTRFSEIVNAEVGAQTNLTLPQLRTIRDHFGLPTMDDVDCPASKTEKFPNQVKPTYQG